MTALGPCESLRPCLLTRSSQQIGEVGIFKHFATLALFVVSLKINFFSLGGRTGNGREESYDSEEFVCVCNHREVKACA